MRLLSLYLLALLDGVLCGLRSSMGRFPLIGKRKYYVQAALRGALGAQIASTIALAALIVILAWSSQRAVLRRDLVETATRMLWVFAPYAGLVLLSLALRLVPSTDVRSMTSVVMLGPLTAIRPLVMAGGVGYGISASRLAETRVLGLFVLALMFALEWALNWHAARAQEARLREAVEQGRTAELRGGAA